MRAHLLLIKLPYAAEALQDQLGALVAVLPRGSRRVVSLEQIVGFLVPHIAIADIQAVHWRKAMQPFSDWWIVGLNGELVCKNKSDDAFRTWMDEFRRAGAIAEGGEAKDVPFPQWREPRVESSVNDLIERTFGKVSMKPLTKREKPQDLD